LGYNEYAGVSAGEQQERCRLIVDRVRIPSHPRANLIALSCDGKDADRKTGARAFRFCYSDSASPGLVPPNCLGQLHTLYPRNFVILIVA